MEGIMLRLAGNESGLAMITAILVMSVVAVLSVAGYSLAAHNLDASGNDRRSAQAIHAAEAGIDRFLDYLNTAPVSGPACSLPAETLGTSPPATFTVTATYYPDQSGTSAALPCPLTSTPAAVVIHSVGTAGGRSRTMESSVWLSSVPGGSPIDNAAVFADSLANWNGAANVLGNPDNADLYSNGDLNLSGGGTVYGNVLSQGSLVLGGTTDVKKDAIAKGTWSSNGGAIVRGNARSSTSSLTNGNVIYGNAYYCTGSAPGGTVNGTKVHECPNPTLPAVPIIPAQFGAGSFPVFTYVPSDWQQAGYTIQTYSTGTNADCTNAQNFINAISSGNYVIRIASACDLRWTGGATVNTKGNLAIVSDGTLTMTSGSSFGNTSSTNHKLFLFFNVSTPRPCAITGISFTGQASTGGNNTTIMYDPCAVKFTGGAFVLNGQIVGGTVTFGSNSTIQYQSTPVPGQNPSGFAEKEQYRREIIS
jgi:hypothetical protein